MYIHICICIQIHIYPQKLMYICIYIHAKICTVSDVKSGNNIYLYIYTCIYIHIYKHKYKCVYVYKYMYEN